MTSTTKNPAHAYSVSPVCGAQKPRVSASLVLPPDEEDLEFFRERLEAQRRKKRREKTRLITRRSLLVGGAAAAVGLLTLPFLPKGSGLNPDDLLKPELAQANPQLIRELCLEFYAHPKREYRLAVAALLLPFEDQEAQTVLINMMQNDTLTDVRQSAARSLTTHRDPATFTTIANAYWRDASIRPGVDQLVLVLDLPALQAEINRLKP